MSTRPVTYGRFTVPDNVCGFSFANTDAAGNVAAQVLALQARITRAMH
jgi:hydroxybutyrate-dimer hydrolase